MRHMLLGAVALLLWGTCRERSAPPLPSVPEASSSDVPADFPAFYRQFHADSLFQIQHISWPLAGLTSQETAHGVWEKKPTYWEKASWRFQRPVDFSTGEFKQTLTALEGHFVVEVISYAQATNYALERRFMRRNDGSWELVYYADMQER